ncbi:MAG TPA: tetratricopeptide repeat protein [Candidatus Krumholzibacteria bacterium]|nr:tetratricopeptide repeat protein [Candidatus Krumholzibacteria bacterium]
MRRIAFVLVVAVGSAALSGCWGAKWAKGPINAEKASLKADTLRAEQRRMAEQLDRVERQLAAESEERTASQARLASTLSDVEEMLRILSSRIEDNEQMQLNRGGRDRSSGSRPSVGSAPAPTDSAALAAQAAEDLYRAAYLDVTRGNYDLAAPAFRDYLAKNPSGARAAEAHYYLGECEYATERWLEAAGQFQQVVRDYPKARLVPAAYLKMGHSYTQLEERGLAGQAYRALIEKHPNSEEAKQARAALNELGG